MEKLKTNKQTSLLQTSAQAICQKVKIQKWSNNRDRLANNK